MNLLFAICVVAATFSCLAIADPEAEWTQYKRSLRKVYPPGWEEKYKQEFARENEFVKKHNALYKEKKVSWVSGLNKYSDLPNEIFNKKLKGFRRHKKKKGLKGQGDRYLPPSLVNDPKLPASFSWVDHGAVSRVKDQGLCGACYTFSAVGALEGLMKIKFNKTVIDLSNQELLDCTQPFGNWGCDGGEMSYSFKYIISKSSHGITSAVNYPYRNSVTRCNDYDQVYAPIKDYVEVPKGDEQAMKAALVHYGPISVALDSTNLRPYKSGIFEDPNCSRENIDHAVLLVGYGTENGQDYWQVKNSWSDTFGEKGFFRILRNRNSHCGIADEGVFPIAAIK